MSIPVICQGGGKGSPFLSYGEWQSYDITLKGKRLSLLWNGHSVYDNIGRHKGDIAIARRALGDLGNTSLIRLILPTFTNL